MIKMDTANSEDISDRIRNAAQRGADVLCIKPTHWGEAPGRIEFIGNHVDYNGGSVLGVAIDRGIGVVVAPREDGKLLLDSSLAESVLVDAGQAVPLNGKASWVNYSLGVWRLLQQRYALPTTGWSLIVDSDLPQGAGLSSSAALELATASALLALYQIKVSPLELAKIGRQAENEFVGMPCGLLDQAVSSYGRRDCLVGLDCANEALFHVPLPENSRFYIFQSGTHHKLAESLYSTRHSECMEAAARLQTREHAREHLADWSPGEWEVYAKSWPDTLRRRARHVISENARVKQVIEDLKTENYSRAGKALYASHLSSQQDFENSVPELDFLVEALKGIPEVLGARLTGGGFGGAVMAWGIEEIPEESIGAIQQQFHQHFGVVPEFQELHAAGGARGGILSI